MLSKEAPPRRRFSALLEESDATDPEDKSMLSDQNCELKRAKYVQLLLASIYLPSDFWFCCAERRDLDVRGSFRRRRKDLRRYVAVLGVLLVSTRCNWC